MTAFVIRLMVTSSTNPPSEKNRFFMTDFFPGTIFHTNRLRSPEKMSKKWYLQFKREEYAGVKRPDYERVFNEMVSKPFDYKNYKLYWPRAELVKIDPISILVENRERFVNVNFDLAGEEGRNEIKE